MIKYLIEVFPTRISSDDRLIMIFFLLGRVMTRAVSSHSNYLLCHNDDGQLHITLLCLSRCTFMVFKNRPQKVAFNNASEASYIYILSGQKFIKMPKIWEVFKNWSLWSNSVTRQVSFKRTKKWWRMPKLKIQMRHFGSFSNTVSLCYSPITLHTYILAK